MSRIILAILAAYLAGCFPAGYLLVRMTTGRDIRATGSGSTGSRNVGRLLGGGAFAATLALDAGKGALAVWLARRCGTEPWLPMAALLAAVAGHVWPLPLRFRGGKGLATYAGGMLLIRPLLLAAGLLLCLPLHAALRETTRTVMLALALSPALMALLPPSRQAARSPAELALYTILAAIVLFAHRANIRRAFGTATERDSCRQQG
jgi:glycerol-3-phosphate acyltransferase PlsY